MSQERVVGLAKCGFCLMVAPALRESTPFSGHSPKSKVGSKTSSTFEKASCEEMNDRLLTNTWATSCTALQHYSS